MFMRTLAAGLKRDVMAFPRVIPRYLSAALEVAREARWDDAPRLVDLVARGTRNILCDQPDVIYSVGFVNVQRGWTYQLRIPASDAFYTIVTVSGAGGQTYWDLLHDRSTASASIDVAISDRSNGRPDLDVSPHQGLSVLFVRQYFGSAVNRAEYEAHRPLLQLERRRDSTRTRRLLPAAALAGPAFLLPRLASLFQARIVGATRLPLHRFVSAPARRSRSEFVDVGRYLVCRYALKDGQSLQVDYDPCGGRWFSISVSNLYLENISHINSLQLERNGTGGFTVVVGRHRGDRTNRLEVGDLSDGLLIFREIRPGPAPQMPVCRVSG